MRVRRLFIATALAAAPLLLTFNPAGAAPAPPLVVTPNPATGADAITFSGAGCVSRPGDPADATPQVYIQLVKVVMPEFGDVDVDPGDNTSPPVTPKADGSWSLTEPSLGPYAPTAAFTFAAVCDGYNWSFDYAPTTLQFNGTTITPAAGMFIINVFDDTPALEVGTSYEVVGIGFKPGETVTLTISGNSSPIGTYTVGDDGSIDEHFTLPSSTTGGAHRLTLTGLSSHVVTTIDITVEALQSTPTAATTTATVTVTSTPPAPPTTRSTSAAAGPVLAATGGPIPALTATGLSLLVGGAGALTMGRKSRTNRGSHRLDSHGVKASLASMHRRSCR